MSASCLSKSCSSRSVGWLSVVAAGRTNNAACVDNIIVFNLPVDVSSVKSPRHKNNGICRSGNLVEPIKWIWLPKRK